MAATVDRRLVKRPGEAEYNLFLMHRGAYSMTASLELNSFFLISEKMKKW